MKGQTDICRQRRIDDPQRVIRETMARQIRLCQKHKASLQPDAASVALDLLAWGQTYLAEHFRLPPSRMHRWLCAELDGLHAERGNKLNVIGPRGSAKSTVATLAYVLRAALEGRERYIWIVSDTVQQADNHLANVKAELIENRALRKAHPAARRGPVWRRSVVVLRNGVAIESYSTGQRIRGRRHRALRPTLIVCDDLQNDQHIDSTLQRDHSRRWFHGTLLKAGTPTTNVINLATALHHDAIALELARTPGWRSETFRSIERWPDQPDLWDVWEQIYRDVDFVSGTALAAGDATRPGVSGTADHRCATVPAAGDATRPGASAHPLTTEVTNPGSAVTAARAFYDAHRAAMDAGAEVLWPEVEDLYTLMSMRAASGRGTFEREKQSSPIDPEQCEWPESYFGDHLWFEEWPSDVRLRIMALDPSKGGDARRGDYSAFVSLAVDSRGVMFIEADLARRPTPQMVAEGAELYRRFRPDRLVIESNQYQELLGTQFTEEFRRQEMHGIAPWLIDNQVNKRVRIRRLGAYLALRRLRFKEGSPGTKLLVDQLRQFPQADHDDGPDALEMAVRTAAEIQGIPMPDDGLGTNLLAG